MVFFRFHRWSTPLTDKTDKTEHILAAVLIVLAAASLLVKAERRPTHGGDFVMICGAVAAMDDGRDPYDRAVLAEYAPNPGLPITYPPLANAVFAPVCQYGRFEVVWIGLLALALMVTRRLVTLSLPVLLAVGIAGYGAFEWTILMGNPAIVEMPLLAAALLAVRHQRASGFGSAIGVATFLKLSPAAYLLAVVPVLTLRKLWAAGVSACVVFAALHGSSMVLQPDATDSYWRSVVTGFDGFVASELATGGDRHPSMYSLANDVSMLATGTTRTGVILAGGGLALGGWALTFLWRHRRYWSGVEVAAFGLTTIMLLSPRLKPYAFVAMVPALAVLLAGLSGLRRISALVIACGMPILAFAATALIRVDGLTGPPLVFKILFGYSQLYAAAVVLGLFASRACYGSDRQNFRGARSGLPAGTNTTSV